MNSLMQRLTKLTVVGITFLLLSVVTYAQSVTEVVLLIDQHWSVQRAITNTGNHIIQQADPLIGIAEDTTLTSQNKYRVDFTPNAGITGTTEIVIQYWQGTNPTLPVIETIRFTIVSTYVDAQDDHAAILMNTSAQGISVLDNDNILPATDTTLTISHISSVQNGTAEISGDEILFTPDPDFKGLAYVHYVACNSEGTCDKAQVSINVQPPYISDTGTIHLSTRTNKKVNVYLPSPGFDSGNEPEHGVLEPIPGDAWTYVPDNGFAGVDTFTMFKGADTSRTVIVTVHFKTSDNTFAINDIIYLHRNATVDFNVFDNDLSGSSYNINSYSVPDSGTLEFLGNGVFNYTPPPDYSGVAEFEYTSCFLTKCETARVLLYVGDMVPRNEETYQLRTLTNTPLVINYAIPLDGFLFNLQAAPVNGDLDIYEGVQTVSLECQEVTGKNLVIYTPDVDFTGTDEFEIHYCLTQSGDCALVKIDVEVIDLGLNMPCLCADGCVWPGDANSDGYVSINDLLTLGWQFGNTGDARDYPDNTMWFAQDADDWEAMQPLTGMNAKYTDSNGDGVINENDVSSIEEHYLMRHTLIPEVVDIKADYQFELIPRFTELDSGDLAVIDIAIGTSTNPVIDMHGVAFSLNLPPELIDSSSLEIHFDENSWLGYDSPTEQLDIKPWDGRIDAGMTRLNGVSASGHGIIGTMTAIIEEDIAGFKPKNGRIPLKVELSGGLMFNGSGFPLEMPNSSATIYLNLNTQDNDTDLDKQLIVFPNPSSDIVQVHLNGKRSMQSIDMFNLSGQMVRRWDNPDDKHFSFDVAGIGQGIYVMRVVTDDGVVNRKIEIINSN